MSDKIMNDDGMAYRLSEGHPWHGKGVGLPDDATLDDYRAAANLNWEIQTAPLFYQRVGPTETVNVPVNRRVMFRADTLNALDVIGSEYVPAQPSEVLEFFRDYLGSGDMTMTTCGSLSGGRYVWGQANLKEGFTLAGGDEVRGKLLIANPNRYGHGLIAKLVLERVVCWNTLTMALSESGRKIILAHNRKFDEPARRDAMTKFGLAAAGFANIKKEATTFAQTRITDDAAVTKVLAGAFKVPLTEKGELLRDSRQVNRCRDLFDGVGDGAGLASAAGTAWGLLNAVTQYVDHEMGRGDANDRLAFSWFGSGDGIKNRARKALWQLT